MSIVIDEKELILLYRAIGMVDGVSVAVSGGLSDALGCAVEILDGVLEDAVARAKVNGGDPCGEVRKNGGV